MLPVELENVLGVPALDQLLLADRETPNHNSNKIREKKPSRAGND